MKHEELLSKLTPEEKAALLSGKTVWQTRDIPRLKIPSIFLSDGPHGIRKQAGAGDHLGLNASLKATCFPTAATIANSWDPDLGEEIGKALGEEAAAQDVNIVLGPGLNMKRSPLCGRNFEYFSEDPYLAGKMAAGYVKGIQSKGVVACPKHFAVNSQELRRMSNDSIVDERTLREIYLTGFEIAVKEGKAKSIMSAYNLVNGTYANENKHLLSDILVDEWGFDGFVVSDWGGSNSHVEAVKNGSHLEMPTVGQDGINEIVKAVKDKTLSEEVLDQRVDELLKIIFETYEATHKLEQKPFDVEAHHKIAQKAAQESIVLLKNEDALLPLMNNETVAVIGDFANTPRYQGAGSSIVNPTKIDSPLDALEQSSLVVNGYAQGYLRNGGKDDNLKAQAVELASKAEAVILYLGLDELAESEGIDRLHMKMAQNQIELLEAIYAVNKNIVVVLSAGAAIEMPWIHKAKAVVHGYLAGQAGAKAIANVLTGIVCPSGKLNETYPLKYEDTPSFAYYPGTQKTSEYREGLYVGYRYFETVKKPVLFPFGYGLSYTFFSYHNLSIDNNQVTFELRNDGEMDGAEIAQVYVSAQNATIFRPAKELKGFQKVFLKAKETKKVTITLDEKAFRYFNQKTNQWEIEEGPYDILVAANVSDIRLKATVVIEGTNAANPYDMNKMQAYQTGQVTRIEDETFEALLGHKIPKTKWEKDKLLGLNDTFSQMYYAKSMLARLIYKILTHMKDSSMKKGKPNLNVLFIYNMPFRGLAKMTGGIMTMDMAKSVLEMVNGHFFKGIKNLIKYFLASKKKTK